MYIQNETISKWLKKYPGKDPKHDGAMLYYYVKFQLDKNLMNQLRMDKVISTDISDTTFYFFQEVSDSKYIKDKPLRNFGLSGYAGNHIAIIFNSKHTIQDIKTEIISTIVHEVNHDYDRTEFHKDDALSFAPKGTNPIKAAGQEIFGTKNVPLDTDMAKSLVYLGKGLNLLSKEGLIAPDTKKGIIWITRIWELKSITKEFIKYCEYKSINWDNTRDEIFLFEFKKWLEKFIEERIGILKDINRTTDYVSEQRLVDFFKKLFSFVETSMIKIMELIRNQQKVKFR